MLLTLPPRAARNDCARRSLGFVATNFPVSSGGAHAPAGSAAAARATRPSAAAVAAPSTPRRVQRAATAPLAAPCSVTTSAPRFPSRVGRAPPRPQPIVGEGVRPPSARRHGSRVGGRTRTLPQAQCTAIRGQRSMPGTNGTIAGRSRQPRRAAASPELRPGPCAGGETADHGPIARGGAPARRPAHRPLTRAARGRQGSARRRSGCRRARCGSEG